MSRKKRPLTWGEAIGLAAPIIVIIGFAAAVLLDARRYWLPYFE